MTRFWLILLLLISTFAGYSQEVHSDKPKIGVLTGFFFDSINQKPIEFVQVRLLNTVDSIFVTGIYSDTIGEFYLDKIPLGNYIAKVTFLGFRTNFYDVSFTTNNFKIDLGKIGLVSDVTTNLEGVDVIGKLDVLKTGIDKKIFNVSEDISSRGGTASDVLNKVPSVSVDQDGNVALRGDGNVTILIDGRPSSFSGGNGKSLLDVIPASSIERIEVVTNPSAKYSPDGTSGIINIVLKKNKLRGSNGLFSASGATDNLFNGTASYSYRNSKFNAYISYTNRYSEGYRNNYGSLYRIFPNDSTTRLDQNRLGFDLNAGHTVRIGSDFYIKSNQIIGVSLTGNSGVRNRSGDLMNYLYDGNLALVNQWERTSYDPSSQLNMDINLNYKINFKDDKGSLTGDFTQSLGTDDISGEYDEGYYNLDSTPSNQNHLKQKLVNFEKNNINTSQLDYARVFDKINARFETGLKSIVRNLGVSTNSSMYDYTSSQYLPDTLANFEYQYNEQVYGGYGIFGQQKGKFKYQGGIRLEQAFQSPYLISTGEKFTNNYFKAYPSGHLKYNHKKHTEWSVSYSRRINRASSSDMNPFTSYSDPFNLRKGNPALRPEFINSFDLGYFIEKSRLTLTTSIYYRQTTDVIQRAKVFYDNNTSAVTFINIDKSQSIGVEVVAIYKPFKWCKNTISFNGSAIKYTDNTANSDYNNNGFTWGVKYIGTVDFWKKTMTAQLNINYSAPSVSAQGIYQRRGSVDVSSEKSLKDGKWSIGMKVTDIFNRQGFSFRIEQPSIIQTSEYKWLTRRYYLTVTYKFGKLEISNKKPANESSGGDF